jgi:hypothetical protein
MNSIAFPHRAIVFLLGSLLGVGLFAQTLVGTAPQPRTALLEEFTAIRCGNCPAAHSVANALAGVHGRDLTIINVHGGALAIPQAGQPDLRTVDGSSLWGLLGVSFQPQGTVNRRPLQSAPAWTNAVTSVLAQPSPANIGLATTFDASTRMLVVDVEVFYTAATGSEDRIHVALTQDGIVGWQTDYVNGNHTNYDHRHVLRDLVTPVGGDTVLAPAPGQLVVRSYALEVPAAWDIDALTAVAFVAASPGEVHQVRSVPAAGGATVGIERTEVDLGPAPYPVPASDVVSVPVPTGWNGGRVWILDAFGRQIASQRLAAENDRIVIDVQHFSGGVYHVRFEPGGVQRFVVAH